MKDSAFLGLRATGLATAILAAALAAEAGAEGFVDMGVNGTKIEADIATQPEKVTSNVSGLHIGGGFRRELTQGSFGVRLELDDLDGELLLAVRALDYRRHLSQRLALTAFAGAARLDLDTPAYGYYLGGGLEIKELWPRWSLTFDLRLGDKLARDNLQSGPQDRPDDFYDFSGLAIYLSRGF